MNAATYVFLAIAVAAGTVNARADQEPDRRIVRVDDGIYVLPAIASAVPDAPRRAAAAFVVGPRGVVVIDSGISYSEGLGILAAVRKITRRPVRLAILTQPEQAALFGAAAFQASAIPVLMHREAAAFMAGRCDTCLRSLKATFGEAAMSGTRVVEPDRLISGDEVIDTIGRRIRLIAPPWSSAPGALAVLDERTATLFAGNIVSIRGVPDTRDANPTGWRDALGVLSATRCKHLISSYGAIGRCSDIDSFARYFTDLETRVAELLHEGVGLGELGERCALPQYASWDGYDELHRANASRVYLRQERALFLAP